MFKMMTPLENKDKDEKMINTIENDNTISQDYLLGGRIAIRQPVHGYRVAIDPIFLAASIDAREGETILDIGTGVGAAALCLASRVPGCRVVGLEVQHSNVRLAAENVALNQMRERVEVLWGDLIQPPPRLAAGTFSHVMANPPYIEAAHSHTSPLEHKKISNTLTNTGLEQWAKFALLMTRPKGTVTFVYRADRLPDILSYFHGKLGDITIYPLWPGEGKPAKRVIVRGRKSTHGPAVLSQGLVLHSSDGRFTSQAEAVLRYGGALEI